MKYTRFSLLIVVALIVAACGGGSEKTQKQLDRTPSWYNSPPSDNGEYLYATASGKSTRRETARQKAIGNASAEMARKLSVKVEALQKIFTEEITSGTQTNYDEAFTNASKTIASEQLKGLATDKVEFSSADNGTQIECFVLVKLPVGDARASLENALSRDKELYVKFKESKAFQELQDDISRLGKDN
ncbi:hypothetical protein EP331_14285 [bacterium]|nr:MAG: hypothetical protein EP331_14285 [bacterium]